VLLLLLAAVGRGDEETALYFVGRARSALKEADLSKAEDWLHRALEEEKDFAPALLLCAEVAQRRGRTAEALTHLERCLAQEDSANLSAEENRAIREARSRLKKLDSARFEFQALVDAHVQKLRALAEKAEEKDPDLARECWHTVQLVQPDSAAAKRHLGEPGGEKPAEEGVDLLAGERRSKWTGRGPEWEIKGGNLVGRLADAANVNRYKTEIVGDYSLVCEARMLEDLGKDPVFGILFGLRGSYDHFGFWIWPESWRLEHQTGERDRDELHKRPFRNHKRGYDRFAWNTYRIDVDGGRITGLVNGKKVFSTSGAVRSLDGYLGFWVQEQAVEVRRLLLIEK
jgi:tetratricopeptide (TPR) repeat protein